MRKNGTLLHALFRTVIASCCLLPHNNACNAFPIITSGARRSAWPHHHCGRQRSLPLMISTQQQHEPQQQQQDSPRVWFATKIQETLDYKKLVQSMYLRHIVLETKEMADIALKEYLNYSRSSITTDDHNPFGTVASSLSVCSLSRDDGGKIGWVDQLQVDDSTCIDSSSAGTGSILPTDVVRILYDERQPKAGDVHIVQSTLTKQFHVILVEELLVRHQRDTSSSISSSSLPVVGTHAGKNAILPVRTLKGQGVTPEFPDFKTNKANNNSNKKYMIQTSGCQMNVADSERLAGVLEHELTMQPTTNSDDADVILFNTCSIRDHAEQKLYDKLGPFAAQKRKGRKLALVVTGCVAQQEGEALLRRIPEVDVVLGPQYVPYLQNVLESVEWGRQVVATAPMLHQDYISSSSDFSNKPVRGHSVRAWVNVINGCNEHCTYCVVPATRGMEQSRIMENILKECRDLAENGYKEVTLLGQNIDAYGRDMVPKRTFADLLEYLNHNLPDEMARIRYVTSHPRYFSDRVIDAVADLDNKICECFHMPFQAGDDEVLRRMRRGYTYSSYMRIIEKIRSKAPDASICGDVIVGFPGETDDAFEKTLQLMQEVKFDNLNTFAYSPRPNTEAALWEDQISEEVKAKRLQRVQKLAAEHGLERSKRYVGRAVEVLVEDRNPRNPDQVMGRTRQGRQVYFDGDLEKLRGELVSVLITEARTWSLVGKLISI